MDYSWLVVGLLAPVLLTVVTSVGAFLGWAIRNYILRQKSAAEIGQILQIAGIAVRAAEQLGGVDGAEKLDKATDIAQKYLDAYNIKVSAKQLRAALESAVLTELLKEPSPLPVEVSNTDSNPVPVDASPSPVPLMAGADPVGLP
jgi:hypothetical protein